MKFNRWHRLLLFLGVRNEFDWAPPGLGPEVNHPYHAHDSLQCCIYCGGGLRHPIHTEPWDGRRRLEIEAAELERRKSRYQRAVEAWATNEATDTGANQDRPGVVFEGWGGPAAYAARKDPGFVEREH